MTSHSLEEEAGEGKHGQVLALSLDVWLHLSCGSHTHIYKSLQWDKTHIYKSLHWDQTHIYTRLYTNAAKVVACDISTTFQQLKKDGKCCFKVLICKCIDQQRTNISENLSVMKWRWTIFEVHYLHDLSWGEGGFGKVGWGACWSMLDVEGEWKDSLWRRRLGSARHPRPAKLPLIFTENKRGMLCKFCGLKHVSHHNCVAYHKMIIIDLRWEQELVLCQLPVEIVWCGNISHHHCTMHSIAMQCNAMYCATLTTLKLLVSPPT